MGLFENKAAKGAISIFLVIILIPTMLFSAVLIDGSRMASARAMAQEATDLAAFSALASYNQKLKDEFGLFAIHDNSKAEEIYKESLSATLLAYGLSENAAYSERIWDIMKTTLTGSKSYMGESFLNLYDFSVDQCTVEPMYCLAEPLVLENQMVEYAKFRGIYVMTDRMDIFSSLGNVQEQAQQNETTAEVMENKMDADEKNAAADRALYTLREQIQDLNTAVTAVKTERDHYLTALRGKMEVIKYENIDTEDEVPSQYEEAASEYEKSRSAFSAAAAAACSQAKAVLRQADTAKKEVEKAIRRLEDFQENNSGKASGNEGAASLIQDAKDNIEIYNQEYLPEIQNLLDDSVLNAMEADTGIQSDLNGIMDDIHSAVTDYIEVIDQLRAEMEEDSDDEEDGGDDDDDDEEITEYYYYYLNQHGNTQDADDALGGAGASYSYRPAVNDRIRYFEGKSWDPEKVNPSRKYGNSSGSAIDETFAEGQSGKTGNPDTSLEGEAERGEVEKSVYDARPSKSFSPESGKSNNTSFFNKESDLSSSKNMLEQGKHSMILEVGETMRDDVLGLTYMFGTFKTRLTGVKKFTSGGMSDSDKQSYYMPKWRYAHPDGELDMRFTPKKDRNTVLRGEIEYLVYGNRTDAANENAVYATIFAERMANNLIALYADKGGSGRMGVNPACHLAAEAASAATLGVVPEPVFFWIFLTAWSTAETVIEMDYLISGGYKIPLLKTKNNILLNRFPSADGSGLISNYNAEQNHSLLVSYEDYLLILLLIKGKDVRIRRTADLIEMNMKKNGESEFAMASAYTYLHADTELSIRYLFGSVMPFQTSYEKNGYSGRMHFTNTIYQGY